MLTTYPPIDDLTKKWIVKAFPDGHLINIADGKEYSYLFWEGEQYSSDYDLSSGFVVTGKDTARFLTEALSKLRLIPKEYNEFIVYWLPRMQNNPYNLVHFEGKRYEETALLLIDPKPDSMLRVFMVYKPLSHKISVKPQILKPFSRKGFTVIEWGGTEIND